MDKIRFGIVGCGVISFHHARAVMAAPDAELVACCDVIPERAEKRAADSGNPKVYLDYNELIADPNVDAVNVCTPSGLHADVAIAAAKAGKHVLCEKPVDITLSKIDEMIAECHKANVKLGVIFQRRTSPMWGKIKQVIDDGKLGKIILGDLYMKYFRSQEYYDSGEWRGTWELDGGGCLMNQGVHMIDLLRYLMGEPESMYAVSDHLVRKIETEDTACAVIKWANGAFGVMQGTTSVTPGLAHRLEIHGELGGIIVEGEGILRWHVPDVPNPEDVKDEVGDASGDATAITSDGHTIQVIDFCDAIKNDRDPMITGEEARKAVEFILGVYESTKTGGVVKFPLK